MRNVLDAVHMLGQAHAIDADDLLGLDIDLGRGFEVGARQTRGSLDLAPVGRADLGLEGFEAVGVLLDEVAVEHARAAGLRTFILDRSTCLHKPRIAAMSPPRRTWRYWCESWSPCPVSISDRILRIDEGLKPDFAHGIEGDDLAAALHGILEGATTRGVRLRLLFCKVSGVADPGHPERTADRSQLDTTVRHETANVAFAEARPPHPARKEDMQPSTALRSSQRRYGW